MLDTEIPDRVSPKDIKDILIYNNQEIVNAINDRIAELEGGGLFQIETQAAEENARMLYALDKDAKPTPEQITEANRQYAEIEWVFNAEPLSVLTGSEFSKTEVDLVTQVESFFKSIGGKVEREGLGAVELTRRGAKDSIAHGIGRDKAAAFKAVPDVIKNGKIIDHQKNWKGRGYDTYVIDAPIKIGQTDFIAEVIINQDNDGQRFYLHEVEIKEKAQSAFKTGMDTGAPQASRLIIAKKQAEVNQVLKSATGNAGTFSRETGNINYALDEAVSADNGSMGEAQEKYREFVSKSWMSGVEHKAGQDIPQADFEFPRDGEGTRHIISSQRIRHIQKKHGNSKKEKSRGQIAIVEDDCYKVPEIISAPTFVIRKIKYEGRDSVLYAKHWDTGTYVYIESVSHRKRGNTAATFFNLSKHRVASNVLKILQNNKKYDIEHAEVNSGGGGGGQPSGLTGTKTSHAVATSANPSHISPLSTNPTEKSSDISELAALEQSAAVDDFKAKFSDLVNSYLGESGYNDLLWIAMNADTEEQAAEYARKMYGDDAATVEKHFFEFAKKHEKKIEDNIAKTGLADTEIADEFDRLVEDGTVIKDITDIAKSIKEAENNPQGSVEEESYLKSVERATRNTLWQEAIASGGEPDPQLIQKLKSMIRNRSTSYRGLYAAITG